MAKLELEDIQQGDWVRFMQSGKPVIGVVQYFYADNTSGYDGELITDMGVTRLHNIVEIRRESNYVYPVKWQDRR